MGILNANPIFLGNYTLNFINHPAGGFQLNSALTFSEAPPSLATIGNVSWTSPYYGQNMGKNCYFPFPFKNSSGVLCELLVVQVTPTQINYFGTSANLQPMNPPAGLTLITPFSNFSVEPNGFFIATNQVSKFDFSYILGTLRNATQIASWNNGTTTYSVINNPVVSNVVYTTINNFNYVGSNTGVNLCKGANGYYHFFGLGGVSGYTTFLGYYNGEFITAGSNLTDLGNLAWAYLYDPGQGNIVVSFDAGASLTYSLLNTSNNLWTFSPYVTPAGFAGEYISQTKNNFVYTQEGKLLDVQNNVYINITSILTTEAISESINSGGGYSYIAPGNLSYIFPRTLIPNSGSNYSAIGIANLNYFSPQTYTGLGKLSQTKNLTPNGRLPYRWNSSPQIIVKD